MDLYYETLYADAIPLIQTTELHELDSMLEIQRDIDRENTEREISEGYLCDHFLNDDRFFGGDDDE